MGLWVLLWEIILIVLMGEKTNTVCVAPLLVLGSHAM